MSPKGQHYWYSRAQDPWCETSGGLLWKCRYCDKQVFEETEPALGHLWGDWKTEYPGTCVQQGMNVRVCSRCGREDYVYSGFGGHDWGEWFTDREPTGTEEGVRKRVCNLDASHVETQPIPPDPQPGLVLSWLSTDTCVYDPALDATVSQPNAGETFTPYQQGELRYSLTNSGNMPLECVVHCSFPEIGKEESLAIGGLAEGASSPFSQFLGYVKQYITPGTETAEILGTVTVSVTVVGNDPKDYTPSAILANAEHTELCRSNTVTRTLTVLQHPQDEKAELTLTWIEDEGMYYTTYWDSFFQEYYPTYEDYPIEGDPFDPDQLMAVLTNIANTGNVPLVVIPYITYDHQNETHVEDVYFHGWEAAPGESAEEIFRYYDALGECITPGTETEALLGTVTVTMYAVGYDPTEDIGYAHFKDMEQAELCRSNIIARTWRVRRPAEKESGVSVSQFVPPSWGPADPSGYQAGEEWAVAARVTNSHVEPELEAYDLFFTTPGVGLHVEDPLPLHGSQDWDEANGVVSLEDVAKKTIDFAPVKVTWTETDAEEEQSALSNSLSLPLSAKTGLLLKKSASNLPAVGYYSAGETINWRLEIKNNSAEPITGVSVTDQGADAGSFARIDPNQTEQGHVPGHVVTEYEAKAVGYVTNQAFAQGMDAQGQAHIYSSNIATAPTWKTIPIHEIPDLGGKSHIETDESADSCDVALMALGETDARWSLRVCRDHQSAAQAAEAARASGDAAGYRQAADIWRKEIEALYQALYDLADPVGQRAVRQDQALFGAYMEALEGVFQEEDPILVQRVMGDLLRLRCAELCYMLHTAPAEWLSSLLGIYARILDRHEYAASAREIAPLKDNYSEMTERLSAALGQAQKTALDTLERGGRDHADMAFVQILSQWQMTLDQQMNDVYDAASEQGRQAICAWRQLLDRLVDARMTLLTAMYPDHPALIREAAANLFRDAAIVVNLFK